ncbi:phenylacetate--CoA ligase family protein [Paenibacillus etheri]|uniref:AMP-dependent synthetase/ligase domain-containing protein n=1 Tax=Paenibacillus etheri TaxID=1306852 RepID=A0A0W1B4C2_9BACL|nr:phenylacetate--CoA ligase family protein [Paenibacillus etheri]KTD88413.1 hypothetical protein UQ64_05100 [Paenibacillus etheri]
MGKRRLIRIIKRLNDPRYIQYGFSHYFGKKIINSKLKDLQAYHLGHDFDFESINRKKLFKILKYASKNSLYYKQLFIENQIDIKNREDFFRIPFLDKSTIREKRNDIMVIPDTKDYISFVTTGGSTGEPLGFYTLGSYDSEHQYFLYRMFGYSPGDKILAMDGTIIPKDLLSKNIFWVRKSDEDIPYGSFALSSQYLTNENKKIYVKFILDFKPSIIRGYPSFIDSIAAYISDNNIELGLEIKGIELTSERFNDYQVENIKRAFNTKIINQYGHAEASVFGYSIDDTLMTYCSPFYGYTEVIGENGIHVQPGEVGEVVVTGFNNYAMPFIRYRTGDLAAYDGLEKGIVRLKQISGRTQDYIYTDDMEKVLLTAIVFGRHYKAFNHIEKWQIVQNTPGEIIFKIIKNDDFSIEDQIELHDNFYNIAKIKAYFEFVEVLPLTKRGKSKLLIQNISV